MNIFEGRSKCGITEENESDFEDLYRIDGLLIRNIDEKVDINSSKTVYETSFDNSEYVQIRKILLSS